MVTYVQQYMYSSNATYTFILSQLNLDLYDTILLPMCSNSHWRLVVRMYICYPKVLVMRLGCTAIYYTQVLDLKNKTVQFQDPLGSYTPSVLPKALISLITSRLKSTTTEWKLIEQPHALPLQRNGYDCGAFICVVCRAHACKRHALTVVLCCVTTS